MQGFCCRFSRPCASWRPLGRCAPRIASATPGSWTTSCASTRFRETKGTKAKKGKAPRITVTVLFALELVVLDTVRRVYIRGFAWVKLLKFWASLRYDDLQWLAPTSMVLTAEGLHATLPRTKTCILDWPTVELQRFIWNLVPMSAYFPCLREDSSLLPLVSRLGHVVLHEGETLEIDSEDMESAFNFFRTPPVWKSFFAFAKKSSLISLPWL